MRQRSPQSPHIAPISSIHYMFVRNDFLGDAVASTSCRATVAVSVYSMFDQKQLFLRSF